jgi:hypothetical protein
VRHAADRATARAWLGSAPSAKCSLRLPIGKGERRTSRRCDGKPREGGGEPQAGGVPAHVLPRVGGPRDWVHTTLCEVRAIGHILLSRESAPSRCCSTSFFLLPGAHMLAVAAASLPLEIVACLCERCPVPLCVRSPTNPPCAKRASENMSGLTLSPSEENLSSVSTAHQPTGAWSTPSRAPRHRITPFRTFLA